MHGFASPDYSGFALITLVFKDASFVTSEETLPGFLYLVKKPAKKPLRRLKFKEKLGLTGGIEEKLH